MSATPPPSWPMGDADPQASRRSGAPGPSHGRLRWTFEAGEASTALGEPLVAPDGRILVSASGPRDSGTLVLSPEGRRVGQLEGVGSVGCAPVLSGKGMLFAPTGSAILAHLLDSGARRWRRDFEQPVLLLRGTPRGDLVAFTLEERFVCLSPIGALRWSAPQDLIGTRGRALAAFDGEGNLYTAESGVVFQRGREITWQSGLSCLGPGGEPGWSELFEPTDGADANGVAHIWGLERGAVFFGRTIRCHEPTGRLRWEIAGPGDFADRVRVAGTQRVLGRDPRLRGGPRVVALEEDGFRHLPAAVDGAGNVYFCEGLRVVSLDPGGVERWRLELEAPPVGGPVVGPGGTLLVSAPGRLFAIG